MLDRLDERGLVVHTVNPDDRRSFVVSTTREGDRAARKVVRVLNPLEQAVRAHVSERDTAGLRARSSTR